LFTKVFDRWQFSSTKRFKLDLPIAANFNIPGADAGPVSFKFVLSVDNSIEGSLFARGLLALLEFILTFKDVA